MDSYDKQKETHGKWATFVWLGSGVYLFITTDSASFLSWQAAVYFLVGMFVAALLFGMAAYILQRGMAKMLANTISTPSTGVVAAIQALGLAIFILETVVIFFCAQWIVRQVLFG